MTSEKLAQLSVEEMTKKILAKSGVVSFARVVRIVRDALNLAGSPHLLDKQAILGHLMANSVTVMADTQSFIADSSLVFPESKRKIALRDAVIVSLLKQGALDATQLMTDANCDFKLLGPIIETVAFCDKRTKAF